MTIRQYFDIISSNNLFTSLAEKELLFLLQKNNQKVSNYEKGSLIYIENETCSTFDIILQGKIVIQKIHENGNILTISEFKQGEDLGGNLVFADNNTYPMTVIAKTKCTILHLDKDLILELCQLNKDFLYGFLRSLSYKTIIISEKLRSIPMRTIRQRILKFLMDEYYRQETLKINLNMTKKEWAEKLGIQRPSLSRELIKMKQEGLIDYTRSYILIKNVAVLNNLVR